MVSGITIGPTAEVYDSAKAEPQEIEYIFSFGAMLRSKTKYLGEGQNNSPLHFSNLENKDVFQIPSRSNASTPVTIPEILNHFHKNATGLR